MTDKQSTEPLAGLRREEILQWLQARMFPYKPETGPYLAGMAVSANDAKEYGQMCWQAASEIREEALERVARRIAPLTFRSYSSMADFDVKLTTMTGQVLEILRDEMTKR